MRKAGVLPVDDKGIEKNWVDEEIKRIKHAGKPVGTDEEDLSVIADMADEQRVWWNQTMKRVGNKPTTRVPLPVDEDDILEAFSRGEEVCSLTL